MRGKFQTTTFLPERHVQMSDRTLRAAVIVFVIVVAAGSSKSADVRQEAPDRSVAAANEATTGKKCSSDAEPTSNDEARVEALLATLDPTGSQASAAVPILLDTIRVPQSKAGLRERSAMMLARIGEPARKAVPVLIEILDRSGKTSSSGAGATGTKEVSTAANTSYWCMKSLGMFGPVAAEAVPSVTIFLRSPESSSQLRVLAADTLGQIRTSAAIGVLTAELMKPRRSSDYESILLRQTIIDGLAFAGPLAAGAIPALGRATEDDNADVRRRACDALGALGPRAEGAMNSLLERLILDEDAAVQDAAAHALAQVGDPAVESLVDLLERASPDVQWRAAKALGQVRPAAKSAFESLRRAFDSSSAQVRIEAIDAAWKISQTPQTVAAALVKTLSEDDRQIRRRAASLLVELKPLPRDTFVALQKLAADGNANERRAAERVIQERSRQAAQQ
jgi:HEAT repeat protein